MNEDTLLMFYESNLSLEKECNFKEGEITFTSLYQYLMYHKAIVVGCPDLAKKLLSIKNVDEQKETSKLFPLEKEKLWRNVAKQATYKGCYLKITQNQDFQSELCSTEDKYFVYTSPDDVLWGVGLAESDPKVHDKMCWEGLNWLGETLTVLRDDFTRGLK